ncbi:enoyl-CoA hydratase/isomerase family protein [Conexibacter sp. W3-3-2]|uniref:enoyl-CoA hydratase/isomerase family protein n=1 Tax=Conexibacter sp. W3-3-2 TaxID=2675227 RepID=UPI00132ADAD8|nr:enoyl-CoA hydratase-related protein [Conexibacter sp. W3-3-2]MTD45828.1 enoyl-CoA hydratase/isomerase family protein [Conexibacter sp. W3-3-2]
MPDDLSSLTLAVADGVATVTLAQGDRGNPFDATLCAELALVATECAEDPAVRAVLIRAEGRFFSVGGDLGALGASHEELPRFVQNATTGFHSAMSRFARMDAPVVCAVHALAAGGGVSLAAGADFVLAAASARFYAAYQGIGLAIDGGGSHSVPRKVGAARALSFYLRNETWTAEQAHAYGLVTEVVPDGELADAAHALAAELAAGPTRAFGEVKNLLRATWDTPLEAQLEQEARAMVRAGRTDDAWNAIQAVGRKERPTFGGS